MNEDENTEYGIRNMDKVRTKIDFDARAIDSPPHHVASVYDCKRLLSVMHLVVGSTAAGTGCAAFLYYYGYNIKKKKQSFQSGGVQGGGKNLAIPIIKILFLAIPLFPGRGAQRRDYFRPAPGVSPHFRITHSPPADQGRKVSRSCYS